MKNILISRLALLPVVLLGAAACGDGAPGNGARGTASGARAIPDAIACDQCEISFATLATLGSPGDSTSIREDAMHGQCSIGRLSTGQYVVGGIVGGGGIGVYEDGRLTHTIGRQGEGPGEYGEDLLLVVGSGDTIHVIDNALSRVTRTTSAGDFLGSFRVQRRITNFALLADGNLLLHGRPSSGEDQRPLFQIVDPAGTEVAAFGTPSAELSDLDQWTVTARPNGGFWGANLFRYEMYRWNTADSLVQTVVRDAEFFPADQDLSPERFSKMYKELPPPMLMWHIWEDGAGRLWTYSLVPALDWEPGPIGPNVAEWTRKHLDTMVEVIDLDASRVIARHRNEDVLTPLCGTGLMYLVTQTQAGDIRADILKPELRGG